MSSKRTRLTIGAGVVAVATLVAGTTAFASGRGPKAVTDEGAGVRAALTPGSGAGAIAWNQELEAIEKTPGAQPATIHPTRSYALLGVAEYDAVVSITHLEDPYLFEVAADRQARPDAAADQAAHDTLVSLFPSMAPQLDHMLAGQLAALPPGPGTEEGIRVGQLAATFILAARADDGSATPPAPFTPGPATPGAYQLTPPNHPAPVFSNWGGITPFVLDAGAQFRPPPPPPLSGATWAQAINEAQILGQKTSSTRTSDETTAAQFWAPPIWNTWNEIADGQAAARHSDLEETVRMYASLNLALGDASIALYDGKYHYLFWRPITAIREGTPGNPAVGANPTWDAFATTAADPSYPGAHSTFSETAATVLSSLFGPAVDLTIRSDGLAGVTRHFTSFQGAADEAGLSRIWAGQHTRIDHEAGQALGRSVAQFVLAHAATPD